MTVLLNPKPYFVFESAVVRREYYKDSLGGVHIKTMWKKIPPAESTEWDFDED